MYAVIRVRGRTGIKKNIADNLNMLKKVKITSHGEKFQKIHLKN